MRFQTSIIPDQPVLSVIYLLGIHIMVEKSVFSYLFPLCAGLAVIAVRIDRYSAAGRKLAPDFNIFGIHELYKILHYDIHAILMKIAVITE